MIVNTDKREINIITKRKFKKINKKGWILPIGYYAEFRQTNEIAIDFVDAVNMIKFLKNVSSKNALFVVSKKTYSKFKKNKNNHNIKLLCDIGGKNMTTTGCKEFIFFGYFKSEKDYCVWKLKS